MGERIISPGSLGLRPELCQGQREFFTRLALSRPRNFNDLAVHVRFRRRGSREKVRTTVWQSITDSPVGNIFSVAAKRRERRVGKERCRKKA